MPNDHLFLIFATIYVILLLGLSSELKDKGELFTPKLLFLSGKDFKSEKGNYWLAGIWLNYLAAFVFLIN